MGFVDSTLEQQLFKYDLYYWTRKKRRIKGEIWSFDQREYLKQLYRDQSNDLVFVKGRQVEMSEYSVNKSVQFSTENEKTTVLYTFPSDDLCEIFGNKRVLEAIKDSPELCETVVNNGSKLTKTFKNGSFLYLRTAFDGGNKARSIDADMLVCDEYQDFDARTTNDVPARDVLIENLSHSKYQKILTLGTPKLKDSHFEQLWDSSSKQFWHVVCSNCLFEQVLGLSNIINFDIAFQEDDLDCVYYGCIKCSEQLDRSRGSWKPTNQNASKHSPSGYHISQLIVPWKPAPEIMRRHGTKNIKGKSIRGFYNEVLGEFYAGSDQPFNEEVLELCYKTDETIWDASNKTTYMGIDWGDISTICVIIFDHEKDIAQIVYADKFEQDDLLEQTRAIGDLVQRFCIQTIVADAGYGKIQNSELMKRFPGRVWANTYSHTKSTEFYTWDQKKHTVVTDREQVITLLVDRAEKGYQVAGGLVIPRDHKAKHYLSIPFLKEMKNVVAVQKNNRTIYERIGSGDHFMHALVYSIIAAQRQISRSTVTTRSSIVRMGGARFGGLVRRGR